MLDLLEDMMEVETLAEDMNEINEILEEELSNV
jgi:hypothetical protein